MKGETLRCFFWFQSFLCFIFVSMKLFFYFIFFLSFVPAAAQSFVAGTDSLIDCDLLFHLPSDENYITSATSHDSLPPTDHVAVFFRKSGVGLVVEAVHEGVRVICADSLLASGGKWITVRLNSVDRTASLANALSYIGRPYDFRFDSSDSEIYCSELVQKSFVDKNGMAVFTTIPMSFHDNQGFILQYWKDYYRDRWGMEVPEGAPGSNPSQILREAVQKK